MENMISAAEVLAKEKHLNIDDIRIRDDDAALYEYDDNWYWLCYKCGDTYIILEYLDGKQHFNMVRRFP